MARKQFVSYKKNAPNRSISSKEAALHQRGQADSTVRVENGMESANSPLSSDTSDDSLMKDDSDLDLQTVAMEVLPSAGGRGKQLRFPVISKGKESRLTAPGNSDSESYASISSEGEDDQSIEEDRDVSMESEEDVEDKEEEKKADAMKEVKVASYPIKAHRVRKRHRPDTTYLKQMSTYIFDCLLSVRCDTEMEILSSQRHDEFRKRLELGHVERVQWKPDEQCKKMAIKETQKRDKTGKKQKKKKRVEKKQSENETKVAEGKDEVRKVETSKKRTSNTSTGSTNGVEKSDRKCNENQQPVEKRKNGLSASRRTSSVKKEPVSDTNTKKNTQLAEKDSKLGSTKTKKQPVFDTNHKTNQQTADKEPKLAPTKTKKEPVFDTNPKKNTELAEKDAKSASSTRIKKESVLSKNHTTNAQTADKDRESASTRTKTELISDTTDKTNTQSGEKDTKHTFNNCKRKLEHVQEDTHTTQKVARPVASFLIEFQPDPDFEKLRKEAAELNEQARKLKHEGNRQGGVNSDSRRQVAQGVLYLRSAVKFFQHALKLAQIKATFRAQNDPQQARTYGEYCITTLSQTCALIESTIRTFKSAADVRMMAIGYKMASIVHLTIYRLQHLKLFALYSDLFTPGRSPDSRQNGTTPPIVNITVGNQDNKEGTVKKHLLKEMEHLLRGFDMWRRFETCNMNVLPLSTDPVTVNVSEFVFELERELQNS